MAKEKENTKESKEELKKTDVSTDREVIKDSYDEGLMGVICGKVIDKVMAERDLINKVLRIEYQGQRQLDGGRTVNRFRVDIIKD